MTIWAVVLAASAAGVLVGAPSAGSVRLTALAAPGTERAWSPLAVLAAAVGVVAVVAVAGPVAAILAGGGVVLGRRGMAGRRAAAAAATERARALDALSILGADLRAGRTPPEALLAAASVATGATSDALTGAARAAAVGGDVTAALSSAASAVPTALRGVAACWQVCQQTGAGLAGAVERLEDGLRAAEAQRRAVAAELAGPRATAQLLAVLPLAGIGLAAALGAHPVHVLLHTPLGLTCLGGGLLLDAAGLVWSRRLVTSAAPP